ncbi:tRNA-uridine aminocarboxypropyltransferase [Massilia sp. LXY-6]|uniref:tRNA-uridine aminocarboxypropyltransferase n=1 Tax=Massilia sp. LXY-6 TaxID=3379823 RepID=UPI003EDF5CAD
MTTTNPRRATCAACLRAESACICRFATPLASRVELLVLQHPLEVHNAKNSARLLHLCLPSSRLLVGETFPAPELDAVLHADRRMPLLLYPQLPGEAALGLPSPPCIEPALLERPDKLRLVLLDATWRKSRKMLYVNPSLQRLPRLALQDLPPSAYRIRKAHAPDQLSSLEAAAHALIQLEHRLEHYAPLFDAFDAFVEQQSQRFRA